MKTRYETVMQMSSEWNKKYKEESRKLQSSLAEIQTELRAVKARMNNTEEQISDGEDRIMEITQSGQWTENQIKKEESQYKRLMG